MASEEASSLDVRAVTEGVFRGDPAATATLFSAKFDVLLRAARRCARIDEHTALDAVQEATIRVMRTIRPIDSEAQLDAYLARVVRSCVYDILRAEARRRRRESAAAQDQEDRTQLNMATLTEDLAALRRAMSRLDRASRDLVEMRWRAGMTLRTIGDRLGLRTGAVDGRLRRAERRVQLAMTEKKQEGDG